ncbi:MAG: hypothetical protein IJ257_06045 [Treponema sp.]|nr:hypothetical protein [Treponema sp.]
MKKITKVAALLAASALLFGGLFLSCSDSDDDNNNDSGNTEKTQSDTVPEKADDTAGDDKGGSVKQSVTTSTGSWDFSSRSGTPDGANSWDASTALTSDVVLAADSGTGTFTVLTGVKAKYNSGLQFSASKTNTSKGTVSSLKNNFKVTGTGKITFELKVVTASSDYTADGGQKTGIALSADIADSELLDGSTAGTKYTKSFDIDGETNFYIGNLKILSAKFE